MEQKAYFRKGELEVFNPAEEQTDNEEEDLF